MSDTKQGMQHKHVIDILTSHAALEAELTRTREALKVAREELDQFRVPHAHDESNPDYHPLSNTRGWCSACQEKVGLDEDFARDAVTRIDEILGGTQRTEQSEVGTQSPEGEK